MSQMEGARVRPHNKQWYYCILDAKKFHRCGRTVRLRRLGYLWTTYKMGAQNRSSFGG